MDEGERYQKDSATNCKQEVGTGMRITLRMVRTRFPSVPQLQTEELDCLIRDVDTDTQRSLILLDVRGEQEFEISHLENAQHVDPNTKDMSEILTFLNSQVSNQETTKTVLVAYCSVGYRSSSLIQCLMKELEKPEHNSHRHLLELYNLEGSIFKWANEKRELVDSNDCATTTVHPYNIVWGKLLNHELHSTNSHL